MSTSTSMSMSARHRYEDHTGEVALTIHAPELAGVYAQGGRAIAELLLNREPPAGETAPLTLTLAARDPAALLVDFLNELIFRSEVERTVFTELEVTMVGENALEARLRGLADPPLAGQVKAATLHQARVARADDGWEAHVVLDV